MKITETIKITVAKDSKAAKAIKKHMAEKQEFRNAVKNGTLSSYAKQHPEKFANAV